MFLDYFASGLLFFIAGVLFDSVIMIHDIRLQIAKPMRSPRNAINKLSAKTGSVPCILAARDAPGGSNA